jgi:glutathione S-transferase
MYELYYLPGTCSLATHVLLNELGQDLKLIDKAGVTNFENINPALTVPVLVDQGKILQEGASIALYLMEKHKSLFLPEQPDERAKAIQWMMFANASVHPAYSKIFFISKNMPDSEVKNDALTKAGQVVSSLWDVVDAQLRKTKFVSGDLISMGDIMLSVYANWNNFFPGKVRVGSNALRMIHEVSSRPAFKTAVEKEKIRFRVESN